MAWENPLYSGLTIKVRPSRRITRTEFAGLQFLVAARTPDFAVDADVSAPGLPVDYCAATVDHLLRTGDSPGAGALSTPHRGRRRSGRRS